MKAPRCEALQQQLLEAGVGALDSDAQAHLAECEECFAYLEALTQLDEALVALPSHEPSNALLVSTVERIRNLPLQAEPLRSRPRARPFKYVRAGMRGMIATASVATALVALFIVSRRYDAKEVSRSATFSESRGYSEPLFNDSFSADGAGTGGNLPAQSAPMEMADSAIAAAPEPQEKRKDLTAPSEAAAKEELEADFDVAASAADEGEAAPPPPPADSLDPSNSYYRPSGRARAAKPSVRLLDGVNAPLSGDAAPVEFQLDEKANSNRVLQREEFAAGSAEGELLEQSGKDDEAPAGKKSVAANLKSADKGRRQAASPQRENKQQVAAAEPNLALEYLTALKSVDGLTFKEPSGYWSNSYLPGDPVLRSLHSSMVGQDLAVVEQILHRRSGLHLDSLQPSQPFDAPTDAAVAVYLQGDKASVDGPTRMTLQVGLKGTVRGQGIRPAMNMGVVLDLAGSTDPRVLESLWSTVYALNELRDVGDRISLAVVGCESATDLDAAKFRHGYIKVLAAQAASCNGRGGSRLDALRRIAKSVTAADDPNSPLGSSALLLVAPRGPVLDETLLEGFAHRSAVAGMPLSVIAVGDSGDYSQLERVALAGQGSRRVLSNAADAKALIKRELSMVGGIVARAVRLRIRLAPGVRLVDVLGSESLDEARAQRVREAEKSVDQRISKNLGIQADRGEDEEGIQIVIPVFMAADAHVVLLDVVVPGPGPVADVTVRFKDLAYLKNGIARANFSLGNRASAGADKLGALEQNVLKNRLAFDTAEVLGGASALIRANDRVAAVKLLRDQERLLESFAALISGFMRDSDLQRDIQLLRDYAQIIESGETPWLSNSLEYAAKRKRQPLPRGE